MHQKKNTFNSLYSSSIYDNAIKLINKSTISKENKKILLDFANNCLARGLTKIRVKKHLFHLRKITEQLNKPLNPHSFRHARATELAQHFTEQQLKVE